MFESFHVGLTPRRSPRKLPRRAYAPTLAKSGTLKQLSDRLHVCERYLPSVRPRDGRVGVDAERVVNRRRDLGRRDGAVDRFRAERVGRTDRLPAADAPAGEERRPDARPVIAAAPRVDVW